MKQIELKTENGYDEKGLPIFMDWEEIQRKYWMFKPDNILLTELPAFIYNVDEKRILNEFNEQFGVFKTIKDVVSEFELKPKPGNRFWTVDTFSVIPKDVYDKKIIVYPLKIKYYRFRIITE